MRVLALTKYGPLAASTRQRFLQYAPALAAAGITLDVAPLLGDDHVRRIVAGTRASPLAVARAYARRVAALLTARRFDILWLHCESFPFLPGWIERLVFVRGRPVVFDFDDAIFHGYDAHRSRTVRRVLGRKLEPVLRGAAACICGNAYLANYASRWCARTIVVPTVVDTDAWVPRDTSDDDALTIGWIGSPTTFAHLAPVLPLLREIAERPDMRVRIIGAGAAAAGHALGAIECVEWREASEIAQVQRFDIGIMPLSDTPFERGKSGYKLVQYMACGVAAVASPVRVNSGIVVEGETGLLATSEEEWRAALERLIADAGLRRRMGQAGRARAVAHYSLGVQAPRLVALFESLGAAR